MDVSVGVIGGGIGGLSAALSLLAAGFDVHVYEQASALGEVGAGVQVSPNASRILHRLGLAEELARTGVKPMAWHQRRWDDGRTLLRSPLAEPLEATFGFPHYQMHRADLLTALAGALPVERVHVGHRLTALVDGDYRVEPSSAFSRQTLQRPSGWRWPTRCGTRASSCSTAPSRRHAS
jgi:salicylate hydroxylase